jgi:penicillin amidase
MTGTLSIVGKTSYFALALTTIHVDSQDLYKEKIEGDFYFVNENQMKLKRRVEVIEIQDEESVNHVIQETHRGPILSFVSYWGTLYKIN